MVKKIVISKKASEKIEGYKTEINFLMEEIKSIQNEEVEAIKTAENLAKNYARETGLWQLLKEYKAIKEDGELKASIKRAEAKAKSLNIKNLGEKIKDIEDLFE